MAGVEPSAMPMSTIPKTSRAISADTASTSSSAGSLLSDVSVIAALFNNGVWIRMKRAGKVALVTPTPFLLVIILTVLSIVHSKCNYDDNQQLVHSVGSAQAIGDLLARLQVERGMTCLCYSTSVEMRNASCQDVLTVRAETDASLDNVATNWPPMNASMSLWSLRTALSRFRHYLNGNYTNRTCVEIIARFYSKATEQLIKFMTRALDNSEGGQLWNTLMAYHVFLLAQEKLGLIRALGGAYFASGSFQHGPDPTRSYGYFAATNGTAAAFLDVVLQLDPNANTVFERLKVEQSELMSYLAEFQQMISPPIDYGQPDACIGGPSQMEPRPDLALHWFSNMSLYMACLNRVGLGLRQSVAVHLHRSASARRNDLAGTVVGSFAVLLTSLVLHLWYVREWRALLRQIHHYARRLNQKRHALKREKARTDFILCEMLPKSVVETLKSRQSVTPEYFEEATVAFSDVTEFTTLVSECTPLQIVDILNDLYSVYDEILDTFDVYKVNTMADACMIASGVPRRNGRNHSAEMATFALTIAMRLEQFRIQQFPEKTLMMRFGIHTGPCAGGIVGTKLQRYCLFGDTVTTAFCMLSHSHAMNVHLSADTADHLKEHHSRMFQLAPRGLIPVKGKGFIASWWLVGKRGFPFRICPKKSTASSDHEASCAL